MKELSGTTDNLSLKRNMTSFLSKMRRACGANFLLSWRNYHDLQTRQRLSSQSAVIFLGIWKYPDFFRKQAFRILFFRIFVSSAPQAPPNGIFRFLNQFLYTSKPFFEPSCLIGWPWKFPDFFGRRQNTRKSPGIFPEKKHCYGDYPFKFLARLPISVHEVEPIRSHPV